MIRTVLAALVLLTATQATVRAETEASASPEAFAGEASLRIDGGQAFIAVHGVITPDVADRFRQILDGLAADVPVVVELDSPGGYTKAGYAMVDAVLRHRGDGRPVETLVRSGAICESMCVGLFMAGHPRRAESGASFMVHAPRHASTGVVSFRAVAAMKTRLLSLGVSRDWLEQASAKGAFSGTLDYHRTADALAQDGSNIVTHLALAH